MYALGGAAHPHGGRAPAGALGDRRLGAARLARRRHRGPGAADPHSVVGVLDGGDRAAALRLVARPLRAGARATRRRWGTRTWRVGPSTSARPMPGRSSWRGSAPSRPSSTRSRFGITVTVLGIAFGVGHRDRPAGQPLQRPPAAVVVHLRLPHGGLGVRDLVRHRGDGLAPGAGQPLAGGERARGRRARCSVAPGTEPRTRASWRRRPATVIDASDGHRPGVGARPPSAAPSSGSSP